MWVEAIAAGVVGAALLWLMFQPLLVPSAPATEVLDPPEPEETPRGQALLAIKEIEFDRATGKLSDEDFAMLHAKYSAAALETLAGDDRDSDALEAMIAARVATLRTGEHPGVARCRMHGVAAAGDARFCPECGGGLVTDSDDCATCHVTVPADAVFCPGCGVKLG